VLRPVMQLFANRRNYHLVTIDRRIVEECPIAPQHSIATNVAVMAVHLRDAPMVSKCANPSCGTDFKYFSEGRIYEFAVADEGVCRPAAEAPARGAKRELFWLCKDCAQQFTLVCADRKIKVVGRQHQAA
jgi:hypothetical protein